MKAFICAILILVLLLTGVLVNAILLNRALSGISRSVASVPVPDKDAKSLSVQRFALKDIYSKWNKARFAAGITVSHENLKETDLLFDSVLGATETDNTDEYVIVIAQLKTVLGQLEEMVRLSPQNIL